MRDAITTWLELAGLLLLAAAAGVAVAHYTLAGGLAVAGAGCIGASAFVAWRAPSPPPVDETSA